MTRIALIDGDVIRYQIGFATQRKTYHVFGKSFLSFTEAAEYAHDEGIPQESIQTTLSADIIQAVYHTVDKFIDNITKSAKADKAVIFLTGEGNYRETVATIRPYKGSRSSDKPIHYAAITEYLLKRYKAQVVDGAEADDALGWGQMDVTYNQQGNTSCICTIDKDLNMIPGYHYDWNKDKFYQVGLDQANLFFYTQLLTGDSVDNIEGCPSIGSKKAKQILEGATSPLNMYRRVQQTYVDHHRKVAEKFNLSCAENEQAIFEAAMRDLEENAHLLWIQREEGVRWVPPTK